MTHINAYIGDVAEKEQAFTNAQGELAEAKRQLEEHPDYEAPKKEEAVEPAEESTEPKDEPIEVKVRKKK